MTAKKDEAPAGKTGDPEHGSKGPVPPYNPGPGRPEEERDQPRRNPVKPRDDEDEPSRDTGEPA